MAPDPEGRLRIEGRVDRPVDLNRADLAALAESAQIPDVSTINPTRRGTGVDFAAVIDQAGPASDATRVILHADRDGFHVALPLAAMRARAVVIYGRDGDPLPDREGGPFRVVVREAAGCATGEELDDCANVKFLSRIELA